MLLSRTCEYAIQAVVYLAKNPERVLIRKMSKDLKIPHHFLGKIMQTLAKAGVLISQKGPKGGFALSKPPSKITMMDVVSAIDGTDSFNRCIIGLPKCDEKTPCPLHTRWAPLRQSISSMLSGKSLAALLKELEK
jgi:Rrf2 family protein